MHNVGIALKMTSVIIFEATWPAASAFAVTSSFIGKDIVMKIGPILVWSI